MSAVDSLALLLPDAPPPYVEHARRVTTFLRLVRDDARAARAASVGVSFDSARGALQEHLRAQGVAALTDLLRLHLYAELGPDTFLWCGEPERELQRCWSELEALREDAPDLPTATAPNESALSVARRLVDGLRQLGTSEVRLALWSARIERAAQGCAAGERAFEVVVRSARGAERVEALCGLVECALDRGAAHLARRLSHELAASAGRDARAARLRVWCALLCDDEAAARALDAAAPTWTARLPQPLVELRAALPEWLAHLAGRPWDPSTRSGRGPTPPRAHTEPAAAVRTPGRGTSDLSKLRRELGACAVAVLRFKHRHSIEVEACEVAPALRERQREWRRALEHAGLAPGTLEHRAILEAQPALAHRRGAGRGGSALRDVVAGAHVQCAAVAPFLDGQGEVAGWLRLEWEHHLAPARARLQALAREYANGADAAAAFGVLPAPCPALSSGLSPGLSPGLSVAPAGAPSGTSTGAFTGTSSGAASQTTPPDRSAFARRADPALRIEWSTDAEAEDGPSAQLFAALVEALGMKTAQRRWWGFDVGPSQARLIAKGGGAAPGSSASAAASTAAGGRRAILRALRTASLVRFDEPRPELSMLAASACGLVLPIRRGGALCGLLALESSRRRDFPDALCQRWMERASEWSLQLRIAQFRAWHVALHGHDVHLGAGAGAWIEPFELAARSNAPVVVFGRAGAGKTIAARWLHFAGRCPERMLELSGALPTDEGVLTEGQPTVLVEHVERLALAHQRRLVEHLDAATPARPGPRWIVTSSTRLDDPATAALLDAGLRVRLERLQLRVPDLAQRRIEIASLLHLVAQRFAREEGLRPPTFDDDAIALLWRQAWPLNVRELENLVFKIVLTAPGGSLRAEDVDRIARRFGVELLRRVGSRAPDASVVRAALLSTMNLRGTVNKTRASMYLGWDPDTLVARMGDLGIDEHDVTRGERSAAGHEPASPLATGEGEAEADEAPR